MKTFACGAILAGLFFTLSHADAPPSPYIPIKAAAHDFRCLNRTTRFGDLLLPDSIVASGGELLVSPVRFTAEPSESLRLLERTERVSIPEKAADHATWHYQAESRDFYLRSSMRGDCDGFCWYEIELEPKHAVTLRSLALTMPRKGGTAKYLHTSSYDWSNVSGGLAEMGGNWTSHFVPYVWLGDEDRGLAWCAESDQGWMREHPEKALSVKSSNDVVSVEMKFLDHDSNITGPIKLRFGLQASPVKPVSFAWRAQARILHDIHYDSFKPGTNGICELDTLRSGGVKTVVIHDSWTKYFGQMEPADAKQFRELIKACHDRGMRLLVYVGYGLARTAPELQGKHDLWSTTPLIPWDPSYKPETRGFDATCPNGPWADWLVSGADKLFSTYDLDGLYFDGTSEAWRCNNQAHGCGWKDEQGTVHAVFPMLAARQLMRRMAETVRRHKSTAILDAHMSSNLTLPTLSFCDSLWNGEQFEGHTSAEKFQIPLSFFRTEFMGYAHGLDMEFLCYENRPFTFDEAIALAWLHGVEVRPYPNSLVHVTPIWRAMDRFGVPEARWQPYWSESGVKCDTANARASAWTRKGRALVFVSHLERTNHTVNVEFDRRRLRLGAGVVRVKDAISGEEIKVGTNRVALSFQGMGWRLLEVH